MARSMSRANSPSCGFEGSTDDRSPAPLKRPASVNRKHQLGKGSPFRCGKDSRYNFSSNPAPNRGSSVKVTLGRTSWATLRLCLALERT